MTKEEFFSRLGALKAREREIERQLKNGSGTGGLALIQELCDVQSEIVRMEVNKSTFLLSLETARRSHGL
jgi:hypothetical protein